MWLPLEIRDNPQALAIVTDLVERMEATQKTLGDLLQIDGRPFHEKKVLTSAMRRFAPLGLATTIIWSANARALRWVIEQRTTLETEIEIRLAFGLVAKIMQDEAPTLFGDFEEIRWPTEPPSGNRRTVRSNHTRRPLVPIEFTRHSGASTIRAGLTS